MKSQKKEIKNQFREACYNIYSENLNRMGYIQVEGLKGRISRAWHIRRSTLSRIETGVLLRICSGKGD